MTEFRVEEADQIAYFDRVSCDSQIRVEFSFEGNIDYTIFRKAVQLSFDLEPILGSKYVEYDKKPKYEKISILNWSKILRLINWDGNRSMIDEFMTQQINPLMEQPVRIAVFRSDYDTVCILMDHLISDIGGLKLYVNLLAKLYRRILENPDYCVQPDLKRSRSMQQVMDSFSIRQKLKLLYRTILPKKKINAWSYSPESPTGSVKSRLITHRISLDLTGQINSYMKSHNAWLNEILLTAYFRALHIMSPPDKKEVMRISIPVDMRKYLPTREAGILCNLTTVISVNIGNEIGETFSDTLLAIQKQMNSLKNNHPWMTIRLKSVILFMVLPYSTLKRKFKSINSDSSNGKNLFSYWFSFFGIFVSNRIKFGDCVMKSLYYAPPAITSNIFYLGITSFNDTITLCTGFECDENTESSIRHFFSVMEDELKTMK